MGSDREPLKVAVIGSDPQGRGFGGRAHVPAVLAIPGMELAAVCTAHSETAQQAAERWNVPRWYGDYQALMESPDIDLVTIAVRVRLHYPIVRAAIEAGKMVYCEWPLGLDSLEANEMVQSAQEAGVVTGVGTQGRFSPGILYLRELLQQGTIGTPLFFHLTNFLPKFEVQSGRWWLAKEEEASGALYVATAHVTDTLQFVLGEIVSLCGVTATLSPQGQFSDTGEPFEWTATDTVSYLARLRSGIGGTVHVSNVSTQESGFYLNIFGENGQLIAMAPGYISYTPTTLFRVYPSDDQLHELEIPQEFYRVPHLSEGSPGYNLGQALIELLRASRGQGEFHPAFEDGYRMHRIIEAIASSSRDGVWEALDNH